MTSKPFYLSRTLWAFVAVFFISTYESLAQMVEKKDLTPAQIIRLIGGGLGCTLGVFFRLDTKKTLTIGTPPKSPPLG